MERSRKQKIIAVLCALATCFALSATMLFTGTHIVADGETNPSQERQTVTAKPYKAYSELTLQVPKDLVVYAGLTTVADLKNNIIVSGRYPSGTSVLESVEYTVSVNDEVLSDDALIVDDPTATSAVRIAIESNDKVANIDQLDVIPLADIPQYTLLQADPPTQIENDHTADTLKKTIAVSGKIAESDETWTPIVNRELLEFTVSNLIADGTADITITYKQNAACTPLTLKQIPVVAAQVTGIFVTVNAEILTFKNGYYKTSDTYAIGDKTDYYGAFVEGMNSTAVQPYVTVYAKYPNSKRPITELANHTVNFTDTGTYGSGTQQINVQVSISGTVYPADSITVSFEQEKVVRLSATTSVSGTLKSSTKLDANSFQVTAFYNRKDEYGVQGKLEGFTNYTIDGSLAYTPKAKNIVKNGDTIETYSKDVRLSYTDDPDVFVDVPFISIAYEKPNSIGDPRGTARRQFYNQKFDLRGLYVEAKYGSGGRTTNRVMLEEYKDFFENGTDGYGIEYFSGDKEYGQGMTVPTVMATQAFITFTYPETNTNSSASFDITVYPADLERPSVDERTISYTEGCSKTITGIDFTNRLAPISVTITDSDTSESITYSYAAGTGAATVSGQNTGILYTPENGKIEFKRGGSFVIRLTLTDGTASNYAWPKSDGYNRDFDRELSYNVRVDRGFLDVRLTDKTQGSSAATAFTATYGDYLSAQALKNALGVQCTPLGSDRALTGENVPDYELWFYGFDKNDNSNTAWTYDDPTADMPVDVGTYYVIAKTTKTNAYRDSMTFLANALTLTITPKEVNASNVAAPKTYERKTGGWQIDDLVSINGGDFLSRDTDKFSDSKQIVTLERTDAATKPIILHADDYGIKLTINSKNYVWTEPAEGSTDTVTENADGYSVIATTFTVEQRKTPEFSATAQNFTYSEGHPNAIESGDDVAYFYPKVQAVEYYTKEYYDGLTADANGYKNPNVANDIIKSQGNDPAKWNAGNYVAFFRTAIDTTAVDDNGNAWNETANDFTLPTAAAYFTVSRKYVGEIELDRITATYDSTAQSFTLNDNFDSKIMSFAVTGSKFGATETDPKLGDIDTTDQSGRVIQATRAGNYTVTLTFTGNHVNNYAWENDPEHLKAETAPDSKELNFTIEQCEVKIIWTTNVETDPSGSDPLQFPYDGSAHAPAWILKVSDGSNLPDADKTLTITTSLYSIDTSTDVDTSVMAGSYRITATKLSSDDYKLPTALNSYYADYTIGKATLELPHLHLDANYGVSWVDGSTTVLTAVYKGDDYVLFSFLSYYQNKAEVVAKLNGAGDSVVPKNVGSYTITVTPNDNYQWAENDKAPKTLTFTITQFAVSIAWKTPDGEIYNGNTHAITATVNNAFGSDQVTVTVTGTGILNATVTDAGAYTATLGANLSGAAKDNYCFATAESDPEKYATYSAAFTIKKKEVSLPTFESYSKDYSDTASERTVSMVASIWNEIKTLVGNPSIEGKDPFGTNAVKTAATFSDGVLFYTDAGTYTVTFTLTETAFKNYCWKGEQDSNSQTQSKTAPAITVNRLTVTVTPWTERTSDNKIKRTFERTGAAIQPTVVLSAAENMLEAICGEDGNDSTTFIERGRYYVKYTVKTGYNPLNYILSDGNFEEITSPTDLALLGAPSDKPSKVTAILDGKDGEVSLTAYYAITNTVLHLEYDFQPYTFGDNVKTPSDGKNFLDTIFSIANEEGYTQDLTALESDIAAGKVKLILTFTDKKDSSNTASYTYNPTTKVVDGVATDSKSILEELLPWFAGEYSVRVEWKFSTGEGEWEGVAPSDNQAPDQTVSLTVNALEITADDVVWNGEKTVTYDGQTHTLKATLKDGFAPVRGGVKADKVDFTVDSVKDVAYSGEQVTAQTLYATKIDGDDAANYVLASAKPSSTITINPRPITVNVNSPSAHVYGDAIDLGDTPYTIVGQDFYESNVKYIVIKIKQDDSYVTGTPEAGTYSLVAELDANVPHYNNYVLSPDCTVGTLTVVKRQVEITVDTSKTTSEYGENVVTLDSHVYTIASKNGNPAFAVDSSVFALTAADVSKSANIGNYPIAVENKAEKNYDITLVGTPQYVITPATLTVKVDITIYFGEENPWSACYKTANTDLINKPYTVEGLKNVNNDPTNFYTAAEAAKIAGSFTYSVDYTQWQVLSGGTGNVMGTAEIAFNPTELKWGNYVFAAAETKGRLTVEKQPITVTIDDQTSAYYGELQTLTAAVTEQAKSHLHDGKVDYKGGAFTTDAAIYTLTCAAALTTDTINDKTVVTADVNPDGYLISGDYASDAANACYKITFVSREHTGETDGRYIVTPATDWTATVPTVKTLAYNDDDQALLQDAITATRVDREDSINVLYYVNPTETLEGDFDWETNGSTAMPTAFHAGTYHLFYRITAENHKDIIGHVNVTVEKGTNRFTQQFDYLGKVKDGNIESASTVDGVGDQAWTYGDYFVDTADKKMGGFKTPTAAFDGKDGNKNGNKIVVSLSFYERDATLTKTLFEGFELSNENGDIKSELDSVFDATFKYGAGYYVMTYTMGGSAVDGTVDYDPISESRIFRVAKKLLTVTGDQNATVQYGDNYVFGTDTTVDNFGTTISADFVYGETRETALADTVFNWTTHYTPDATNAAGSTHAVTIANRDNYTHADYAFDFIAGNITVVKREITITIGNRENFFDLMNNGVDEEKASIVFGEHADDNQSNTFFNGEVPFILKTAAFDVCADSSKTNNATTYPIYAVWNPINAATFENNYQIKFSGCSFTGTLPNDAITQSGVNCAGTFTVKTTTIVASVTPPDNFVYRAGEEKRYTATGNNGSVEFTPKYYVYDATAVLNKGKYLGDGIAPINVGKYVVEFVYQSKDGQYQNYYPSTTTQVFSITQQTLTVVISATVQSDSYESEPWVQYGTEIDSADPIQGRFGGFTYTFYIGDTTSAANEITKETLDSQEGVSLLAQLGFITDFDHTASVYNSTGNTNRYTVKATGIKADGNYDPKYNIANLYVMRRTIQVTVSDATDGNTFARVTYRGTSYGEDLEKSAANTPSRFFTPESGWAGDTSDNSDLKNLGLTLRIDSSERAPINAGTYRLIAACTNSNYTVTFVDKNNTLRDFEYVIEKKLLKVHVYGVDQIDGETKDNFRVIYGNTPAFRYFFDGFANNESYDWFVSSSSPLMQGKLSDVQYVTPYSPWVSGVGSYTVKYIPLEGTDKLNFDNYELEYIQTDSFRVVPRTIVANTTDQIFKEVRADDGTNGKEGTILYNGERNDGQHAVITFTDKAGVNFETDALSDGTKLATFLPVWNDSDYTLGYTKNGSSVTGAPQTAGVYRVTVTLKETATARNFVFETGKNTLDFTIQKQDIAVAWDVTNLDLETDEKKVRNVLNYYEEIMNVTSFVHWYHADGGDTSVDVARGEADGQYKNDGKTDQLRFTATDAGRYVVTIELKTAAQVNFTLSNSIDTEKNPIRVTLTLVVSAEHVTMTIRKEGWIYGQYNNETNGTVVDKSGAEVGTLSILYARTDLDSMDDIDSALRETFDDSAENMDKLKAIVGDNVLGAFNSTNEPTDVGVYIVRAHASATGQNAFRFFEIKQATVDIPDVATTEGVNDVYTGGTLTLVVELNGNAVNVTAAQCSNVEKTATGATLTATNAGTYSVIFGLQKNAYGKFNYTWKDGTTDPITKQWQIDKADDEVTFTPAADITVDYGEALPAFAADSRFSEKVHYAYYMRTGDAWSDSETAVGSPKDAGDYWIRAVTSDTGNYNGAAAVLKLTVRPLTLTATANGSITYGGGSLVQRYDLSGFLAGESIHNVSPTHEADGYRVYRKGSKTPLSDLTVLNVGDASGIIEYEIEVYGLTYKNYTVAFARGAFVVNPKEVSVTIERTSAVYGTQFDPAAIRATVNEQGVTLADLRLTYALDGVADLTVSIDVDTYHITATSGNPNYTVRVSDGIYAVTKLPIRIAPKAGVTLGGTVGNVAEAMADQFSLYSIGSTIPLPDTSLYNALRFAYSTVDGVAIDLPRSVGRYLVTVTLDTRNYELTGGSASFAFTVDKNVFNASGITVAAAAFDNTTKTPVVDFGDYDADSFEIVRYEGDRVNVGTYRVIIRIKDFENNKWALVDSAEREFICEIVRGKNALVSLDIVGWTFGQYDRDRNAPHAVTAYGVQSEYIYTYYADVDGRPADTPLVGLPTEAGKYYVTVTVPASLNYDRFISDPIAFEVGKAAFDVPDLGFVIEGAGKNDTFTGDALSIKIEGYDSTIMDIVYDPSRMSVDVNGVVQVVNAGDYSVTLKLKNGGNYRWGDGTTLDDDGNAVISWTIGRKKIAKPTANMQTFVVNGKILEYFPDGFDPAIMGISGNQSGYGGSFEVVVTLLDTDNYEWADGTDGSISYVWNIVGVHTVFAIVIGTLSGVAGVAAAIAVVQYVLYRRKKKAEAEEVAE